MAQNNHPKESALSEAHKHFVASIAREALAACQWEKEASSQHWQQKYAQLQQDFQAGRNKDAAAKADHDAAINCLAAQHCSAMADLKSQHAAEAREWESVRCDRDSKMFRYAVRGSSDPRLQGIVPLSILQAEPNSVMATMYNGERDFAKDPEGRIIVNSDPGNWPFILNWLSFGTVPTKPTDSLLSECKYWQLDSMLAAIAAKPASTSGMKPAVEDKYQLTVAGVMLDGSHGFRVTVKIKQFTTQVCGDRHTGLTIPFAAASRDWKMDSLPSAFMLSMLTGPTLTSILLQLECETSYPSSWTVVKSSEEEQVFITNGACVLKNGLVEQLMRPRMLTGEGSSVSSLALTAIFKD